jgi:DNA-binding NtrC family response regulator
VDDEPIIASTLADILRLNGFNAEFFTNPLDALTAANHFHPDLLITEVVMAGISGIDLAKRLKALCPDCKVLMFTGHPDTVKSELATLGEDHEFQFLAKPVIPNTLLAHISKMIA